MKLTSLALVIGLLQLSAHGFSQKISLSVKDARLEKVLKAIKKQTGYQFLYNNQLLDRTSPVTLTLSNATLDQALTASLKGQSLVYTIVERTIIIRQSPPPAPTPLPASPQQPAPTTIHGRITDESGKPAAGISVMVRGTDKGAVTNEQGEFSLAVAGTDVTLIISAVNIETRTVPLNGRTDLVLIVKVKVSGLDDIQIIGYGTSSKRYSTGTVGTVKSEDIDKQPVTNVLSAVSGRVPGVFVQTTNGLPGGGVTIQIRGQNSIGSTPGLLPAGNPLYVVDGVPFAPVLVDNFSTLAFNSINGATSPFNSINPGDIESISILKDADATAIYGSRGANGVVLITTKKGQAGKTRTDINISQGISKIANLPKVLDLQQFLQIRREAFKNDGRIPSANPSSSTYAPELMVWDTTKSTNWPKYMLGGTGKTTNAQVSISGGTTSTNFSVGANYHSETTVLPGDNLYRRTGMHFNLMHTTSDGKFTVSASGIYTSDNNKLANPNYATSDIMLAPDYPLYDTLGNLNWRTANPIGEIKATSKIMTENLVLNSLLKYTLAKGLNIKASIGYNKTSIDQIMTNPKASLYPGTNNYSDFGNNSNKSFIVEPQIDYSIRLGSSRLTALLGGTWQNSIAKGEFIEAGSYSSESLMESISGASTFSASNSYTEYKYASVFGRVTYNLKERYILSGTIRRDGSSRFGSDNQFGNFGSLGAAWLFGSSKWVRTNMPFISYGKIRGSYGITGNDQIADYQYLSTYSSSYNIYQDTSTLKPERIANADFRWETNKKLEFALELGLFRDRILLTVNRFRNRSGNQLVSYSIPQLTGFSSYQANLPALVQNSGWELELNTRNIRTASFSWTTAFNLTIPKNVLKTFAGFATSGYSRTLVIGEDITRVFGYRFAGLDSIGKPLYSTAKGGVTSTPSSETDAYFTLGKRTPVLYGGIGNTFVYKSVQLDIFGQFVRQSTMGSATYTPGLPNNNYHFAVNRWQKPGDRTIVPRASTRGNTPYRSSSANFVDASYLRLKNVSLSYDLPASTLKKMKMERFRIYVLAQNLLTWWNRNSSLPDPESGTFSASARNIPPLRSFQGGIQLTL